MPKEKIEELRRLIQEKPRDDPVEKVLVNSANATPYPWEHAKNTINF